jgi:hypothetical protein
MDVGGASEHLLLQRFLIMFFDFVALYDWCVTTFCMLFWLETATKDT